MRIHKEGFDVLVQSRVEDITNKFELIHPDLLSNLSNLLYYRDEITNGGELLMLAIVSAAQTGNITQHLQAKRQGL